MNCHIVSVSPDVELSKEFYTKLGFNFDSTTPYIFVHGGKAIIEIETNRKYRSGIKFYKSSWVNEISRLKKVCTILEIDNGNVIELPGGSWIFLLYGEESPATVLKPSKNNTTLGNCYGISYQTAEIIRSIEIWSILGFHISKGSIDSGWVGLTNDEAFDISIMTALSCPHLFFNPSISYFNGAENSKIISKIRKLKIPITEEITVFNNENIVDNIIIKDPGGLGYFIFND